MRAVGGQGGSVLANGQTGLVRSAGVNDLTEAVLVLPFWPHQAWWPVPLDLGLRMESRDAWLLSREESRAVVVPSQGEVVP